MYEEILHLLQTRNIVLENGLKPDEIVQAENIYGITFPKSLRDFLMIALPVQKGFYNWRNKDEENITYIKAMIEEPVKYINDMPREIYWCEGWGEEPKDDEVFEREVRERLKGAARLIPIYGHRYMPCEVSDNPPVLSVHGADVIYYGGDLIEYFEVEFGERMQESMNFACIESITFWTDIM